MSVLSFLCCKCTLWYAQFDEQEIVNAVAMNGPVSIAFEVVADFQHYTSGVYSR